MKHEIIIGDLISHQQNLIDFHIMLHDVHERIFHEMESLHDVQME